MRGRGVRAVPFDGMTEPPSRSTALSKSFGKVQAVDDLSFAVEPGRVTGFLGPNGAGKSTTLRMLLGLVRPDAGDGHLRRARATRSCRTRAPRSARCSRTRASIPGAAAATTCACSPPPASHPGSRVDEVLEQVGLADAADRRVKGYSMGMRQRLAIAAALLGDPEVLILDEPANGLDPPGIRWMRDLLRAEAARGRAVLVSSHLLSEVAQSVDDVVVIAHGDAARQRAARAACSAASTARSRACARPRSTGSPACCASAGSTSSRTAGALLVRGAAPERVGAVAAEHRVALTELVAVVALARGRVLRADRGAA